MGKWLGFPTQKKTSKMIRTNRTDGRLNVSYGAGEEHGVCSRFLGRLLLATTVCTIFEVRTVNKSVINFHTVTEWHPSCVKVTLKVFGGSCTDSTE